MLALRWSSSYFGGGCGGTARHGARTSAIRRIPTGGGGGGGGALRLLLRRGAAACPPTSSSGFLVVGGDTLEEMVVTAGESGGGATDSMGVAGGGGGDGVRSPDLVEREYADLRLKEKLGHLGHVRIRQHVNPLSASLSVPPPVPDWKEVFGDSTLPLMVDIGCGSGRFLIWLAKKFPESKNYLGLEIRQKLVKRAQFWVEDLALRNIYFMFTNATVSFEQLVATYPGPLMLVSILCPDPHFKKRHHKRRVLQKPLVDSISRNLNPAGQVFLQSDVREVALEMRNQFDALSDIFEHTDILNPNIVCDGEGWLSGNPMGIRTEREIHAELEGAKIYRRMYQKKVHHSST